MGYVVSHRLFQSSEGSGPTPLTGVPKEGGWEGRSPAVARAPTDPDTRRTPDPPHPRSHSPIPPMVPLGRGMRDPPCGLTLPTTPIPNSGAFALKYSCVVKLECNIGDYGIVSKRECEPEGFLFDAMFHR